MPFSRNLTLVVSAAMNVTTAGTASVSNPPAQPPWKHKVDRWVLAAASAGPAEFLVFLSEQAEVVSAEHLPTKAQKGRFVVDRLRDMAARTQGPLLSDLAAQ